MKEIILNTSEIELLYKNKKSDISTINKVKKIAMLNEEREPMLTYSYDEETKESELYFKNVNTENVSFFEKIINKKTTLVEIEKIMDDNSFFLDSILGLNFYIEIIIPNAFNEIKNSLDTDILTNNINIKKHIKELLEMERIAKYNMNIIEAINAMKNGKKVTSIKWFDYIYAYYDKNNDKFYYYDVLYNETRYLDISEFLDLSGKESLNELLNSKYKIYEIEDMELLINKYKIYESEDMEW